MPPIGMFRAYSEKYLQELHSSLHYIFRFFLFVFCLQERRNKKMSSKYTDNVDTLIVNVTVTKCKINAYSVHVFAYEINLRDGGGHLCMMQERYGSLLIQGPSKAQRGGLSVTCHSDLGPARLIRIHNVRLALDHRSVSIKGLQCRGYLCVYSHYTTWWGKKIDALQLTSKVTNLGAYVRVKASRCLCLAIGNVKKNLHRSFRFENGLPGPFQKLLL